MKLLLIHRGKILYRVTILVNIGGIYYAVVVVFYFRIYVHTNNEIQQQDSNVPIYKVLYHILYGCVYMYDMYVLKRSKCFTVYIFAYLMFGHLSIFMCEQHSTFTVIRKLRTFLIVSELN